MGHPALEPTTVSSHGSMLRREECLAIVRELWLYLDGALPDELQARVAAHLMECGECSSHVECARAFLAALRMYGQPSATLDSEALRSRVLHRLRAADDRVS